MGRLGQRLGDERTEVFGRGSGRERGEHHLQPQLPRSGKLGHREDDGGAADTLLLRPSVGGPAEQAPAGGLPPDRPPHLVSLEAFLDKSILFGFSFGINKAEVAVAEGKLLGHKIGRSGSSPDEERCQAVVDFPPLRERLHIQQFLGCANWLRGYLPAEYGHAAKVLGQWQKPGAEFPEGGLGAGATAGCKAFKAIKQMTQWAG